VALFVSIAQISLHAETIFWERKVLYIIVPIALLTLLEMYRMRWQALLVVLGEGYLVIIDGCGKGRPWLFSGDASDSVAERQKIVSA
jgi:hypothetical protein